VRLTDAGVAPEVACRSVIDPTQDMARIQAGGPMPFGASQEAIEAWLSHCPDERVPALGELTLRAARRTPRAAAKRKKERIAPGGAPAGVLEDDVHLLARQGTPAPDLARLRAELGMESR